MSSMKSCAKGLFLLEVDLSDNVCKIFACVYFKTAGVCRYIIQLCYEFVCIFLQICIR